MVLAQQQHPLEQVVPLEALRPEADLAEGGVAPQRPLEEAQRTRKQGRCDRRHDRRAPKRMVGSLSISKHDM